MGSKGRTDRTGDSDLGRRAVEQRLLREAGDVQQGLPRPNPKDRYRRLRHFPTPPSLRLLPRLRNVGVGAYAESGYAVEYTADLRLSSRWNH